MSYIGNTPGDKYLTLEKQTFTTSATDTYTLDREVSGVNDIELFLNNVRQEPTEAYTISGTTLTLASPITSSDSMYCIYQGRAVGTTKPANNTVTNDMISYPLAKSGATVSTFNRTSSTGDIVEFQKDGTEVGVIGTVSSNLYVGSGDTGIYFNNSEDRVYPINTTTVAGRDNGIDLGKSDTRWKDFYLGGSIYLGGTGSANALDDYEEGTWTASLVGSSTNPSTPVTVTASYTKIGRYVYVNGQFSNVNTTGASGGVRITGMPFTPSGVNFGGGVMTHTRFSFPSANNISPHATSGGYIAFYQSISGSSWSEISHSAGTGAYLSFGVIYITA